MSEPPFSLTPDPRFLFASDQHREGSAHLRYGVQQAGGFVQLTGEVGCGKTTLCRSLVNQLQPDTDIALILNPRLTALELLATICDELRIPYPARAESPKVLIDALNQHLLQSHAQRRRTVLMIDEAQNLDGEVLEQIRLLTNLETAREKLLQIILIGQPELLSILRNRKLRQLAQRVTARYHLLPLSRRETCAYVRHRLEVAGRRDSLFTPWAMRCVHHASGGVPRLINIVCDRALLGAYSLNRKRVNAAIVRKAARESRGILPWYRRMRPAWSQGLVALAILIGIAVLLTVADPFALRRPAETAAATGNGNPVRAADPEPVSTAHPAEIPSPPAAPAPPDPGALTLAASTGPKLAEVLADPSLYGDSRTSFHALYAQWGVNIQLGEADLGCLVAREHGFECLFQLGGWPKLRRFDLPTILELVMPSGAKYRATLVALGEEVATLAIGDREYTFPLAEIDRIWDGSFILLWKPPFAPHQLEPGARGDDVVWVRQTLDTLEGKSASPAVSDSYDEGLQRRVAEYQRRRLLIPDGLVGSETLVRLAADLEGPGAPSLSRRAR